jgi:hypothetical protein
LVRFSFFFLNFCMYIYTKNQIAVQLLKYVFSLNYFYLGKIQNQSGFNISTGSQGILQQFREIHRKS